MAKHHKRLLVGIAVGIAVSAVTIGSSAINGRTSNAGSETTDKVRIVDDRKTHRSMRVVRMTPVDSGFEGPESILVTVNPLEESCWS